MRFWDSSAVMALLVLEPQTARMTELLQEDQAMAVWWSCRIECTSGIRRRERAGTMNSEISAKSLLRLDAIAGGWSEILPGNRLRSHAERLLATHPLRAADALQLAAAIEWRRDPGAKPDFVCLDDRLTDAASREGFRCLPVS